MSNIANASNIIKIELTPKIIRDISKKDNKKIPPRIYTLRNRSKVNYAEEGDDEVLVKRKVSSDESFAKSSSLNKGSKRKERRHIKFRNKKKSHNSESNSSSVSSHIEKNYSDYIVKAYKERYIGFKYEQPDEYLKECKRYIVEAKELIKRYENEFYEQEVVDNSDTFDIVPSQSIPICADITQFDFSELARAQTELAGELFSVIMIDPPWPIGSSNPIRGVNISYETLSDNDIISIPIKKLQDNGFIFIWTINSKYKFTIKLLESWGYTYCDEIVWIKQTVNGKLAKGNGYYLQHSKESCLIGRKGNPVFVPNSSNDIIYSKRRGQSQKPDEIYEIIERLMPNRYYLEIFGRRNNLRNNWVTVGNEI